jgi:dCMP deaminase
MDKSFIEIAKIISIKSKDPNTKVGAIIVKGDKIISTGRNGTVAGCDETYMTYERPLKYQLVIHAEINALLFAKTDVSGMTIYITLSPCCDCLKAILQSGIRVIYYSQLYDKYELIHKDAIKLLVISTGAKVINTTNNLDIILEFTNNLHIQDIIV